MPNKVSLDSAQLAQGVSHNPLKRGSDRMRRLVIGIGGVLAVLLLIGLASLISDQRVSEAQTAAETAPTPGDAGSEPLAEFGVQPSATVPEASSVTTPNGSPAIKGGTVPDLQPEKTPAKAQ